MFPDFEGGILFLAEGCLMANRSTSFSARFLLIGAPLLTLLIVVPRFVLVHST